MHGDTPLHRAAHHGNVEFIKLLIMSNAELNKVNTMGVTPLYYARKAGHTVAAQLLIDSGAGMKQNPSCEYSNLPLSDASLDAEGQDLPDDSSTDEEYKSPRGSVKETIKEVIFLSLYLEVLMLCL